MPSQGEIKQALRPPWVAEVVKSIGILAGGSQVALAPDNPATEGRRASELAVGAQRREHRQHPSVVVGGVG